MSGRSKHVANDTTEEKIKSAARKVFTQKGYAATRTRDIAEESGYNLALINYYFRSKEKLFELIMLDTLQLFVDSIRDILNDTNTTLQEKIEALVGHYIDMLIANPGVPLFMLNEVNTNPKKLLNTIGKNVHPEQTVAAKQLMEFMAGRNVAINPLHLFMNAVAVTVFPFIGAPMIKAKTGIDQDTFNALMQERKKLIPQWIQHWLETGVPKG